MKPKTLGILDGYTIFEDEWIYAFWNEHLLIIIFLFNAFNIYVDSKNTCSL